MEIADFPHLRKHGEFSQGCGEDFLMPLAVLRRTESAADRMIDENRSGRTHLGHYVEGGADDQGGNLSIFDNVGDETDGLVAKGSIGD